MMRHTLIRLAAYAGLTLKLSTPAFGAISGITGLGAPVDNMQPSLALNYLVRVTGSDELGEVVPFAGSFAPAGWALADGRLLTINENVDLFQRLGTAYGGDGLSTFALPDLRGRTAVHRGAGVGLTNRSLGDSFGAETDVLMLQNLRLHNHDVPGGGSTVPAGFEPQAFNNYQPSLALNYAVALTGNVPMPTAPQDPSWYGQVRLFAGSGAPGGFAPADGQILPVSTNFGLLNILSNRYGGDGIATLALPDLRGRTPIHVGAAGSGPTHAFAATAGSEGVTMDYSIMPTHQHTLPAPAFATLPRGEGQSYDNMQPSLTLNYIICIQGNLPSESLGAAEPFLGEVALFAGGFAPAGWALADGQLLPTNSFAGLFSVLGSAYGGDGVSTFALPDLRGRAIVGVGQGTGLTPRSRGDAFGAEHAQLTVDQLPPHAHPVSFNADFNFDGVIDGADVLIWQRNFGALNAQRHQGNADPDTDVDAFDLAIWKTEFGGPALPLESVPEPTTLALALTAAGLLYRARRPFDRKGASRG
ncbi:phage tail protein [Lacipirellula limnantheis]|uniref:Phage Tail Collar Domain protein n=1 Tax=Lacipirellula limnantheis TaxID=2528024 RepID=A0A517TYU8_9BACT|nr:tail fiber protein [Lacipirellula limnantheis]QDT73550.1 Phage Tail Collar Domain protein [Lacipirellula limnantheis]